jgi:hypothetical protein
MEAGRSSNSNFADGIDKLLCLLTSSHRLGEYNSTYGKQNSKFKNQVQNITKIYFTFLYCHLLVVVLFSPSCEIQVCDKMVQTDLPTAYNLPAYQFT